MNRRTLGSAIQGSIVGLVGVAGLLKFTDLSEFWTSLSSWRLVPPWSIDAIALGLPVIEVFVAGLWIVCGRRRLAVIGAALLLLVFTLAFALHLILVGTPECNCFGVVSRFLSQRGEAWWTLARNAAMLALLVLGAALQRTRNAPASGQGAGVGTHTPSSDPTAKTRHDPRAFTLIEMIIVIALVGILVALILPSLRNVRRSAREMGSISNLHTHAATMTAYAGDYDDWFPLLADAEATFTVFRHAGVTAQVRFFDVHLVWNFPLADDYYGGDHLHPSFTRPWGTRDHTTEYYLSHALMTRPEFWAPETRVGPVQWRGCRASEALFPSAKGVIVEADLTDTFELNPRVGARFSCVDGSARDWRHEAFRFPYAPLATGQWPGSSYLESRHVMHTIDGVRGRDFD